MKNIRCLFILILISQSIALRAQIGVDYQWTKVRFTFSPLSPLPAGETFSIDLPGGLTYLTSKADVKRFWNGSGFHLPNDIDETDPSITFRIVMEGMIVTDSDVIKSVEPIQKRTTFMRQYTFTFQTTLQVFDNKANTVLRTIIIHGDKQEFRRKLHRNFFNPYKPDLPPSEVGFDSLIHLSRYAEVVVLKKMESEFLAETFEQIKRVILNQYGYASLKADIAILNPQQKRRPEDLSGYDQGALNFKRAVQQLNTSTRDTSYLSFLNKADKFYEQSATKMAARRKVYLPAMIYWNLSVIKLLKGDFKKADAYHTLFQKAHWPEQNDFASRLMPAWSEMRSFFTMRYSNTAAGR